MMGIFEKLVGGNVLFYPGCMFKFALKDLQKNYEIILRKCGIDFIKLKDLEVCCGSPLLNAGYLNNFKILAKKNYDTFKQHSIKKIITPCPACFKTFKLEYPKVLNKFDIETEHITQTIANALNRGKLKLRKVETSMKVTYHDPCHLGRYCGIYEEPRQIIKHLGYDLVEMEFNRQNAFCCGAGGGVKVNYSELSKEIAKDRIEQAQKTKTNSLITCCPMCYACFKKAGEENGIDVFELSSLLVNSLK